MNKSLEISDQDIVRILQECEEQNEQYMMTQQVNMQTTKSVIAKRSSPKIPIFNNCHISGNITININKKETKKILSPTRTIMIFEPVTTLSLLENRRL